MIILQNQKSAQSNIIDLSCAILQDTNWYQEEAEKGDKVAQYNLGCLYERGEGTEKNLEKAFYWYQKAADNGHSDAQWWLGYLYERGERIEKNLENAFY